MPRIMVVEDERISALNICRKLTRLGYRTPVAVASGAAALRAIEAARPDLVLMDIRIEGAIDGMQTAALIPPEYRIPVIYLTAHSDAATLRRAAATNPHGYLLKPFIERELHATVQMALVRQHGEATLRATEQRLHRARMDAFRGLAGGVATDFSQLLNVMLSNLEELSDRASGQPDLTGLIQTVFDTALLGDQLARRLLAFSQRQFLVPTTVSLNRLIPGMTDALHRILSPSTEIRSVLPPTLWDVRADADELERAILNLANNARDAMPRGGALVFEGENVVLDEPRATALNDVASGRYVRLDVTDTGHGMTTHVASNAFEPFFTTRPSKQNAGLGLSQVFGFVRQSGGHVGIESRPGDGTSIRIHLPAVAEPREHRAV